MMPVEAIMLKLPQILNPFSILVALISPFMYGGKRDLTNKVMLLPYLPIKSVVVMFQRLLYSLQLIQIMLMRAQTLSLE